MLGLQISDSLRVIHFRANPRVLTKLVPVMKTTQIQSSKLSQILAILFATFFITASMNASAQSNLITNGSFESGTTGWVNSNSGLNFLYGYGAYAGTYHIAMAAFGSPESMSQTVNSLRVGSPYTLSFYFRTQDGYTPNSLTVTFGSSTLLSQVNSTVSVYTRYSYIVNPTSSSVLLSFSALNYWAFSYLDEISLYLNYSAADTQASLVNTASALQNTFALQNAVLANSFSYDCNTFGANNVCVSTGGRNTAVSAANGLNNTSGLLIAAYRPHPNYRIGAYADQNLSVNNAGSTVSLGNNTPLIGLFGAWNERLDGLGTEVKVSAAYGQKNTTVTRAVVGTSEPGSGSSQLNSQGAQITAKYGFAVTDKAIVSPYVGVRYTQNNMGGYTEATSTTVTAPLTYSALNTNATTALAGVGASYKVIPTVTTFASAGVETDTNTANGSYYGTSSSISGLTPVNFNANPVKTRPTAMLGASYEIEKNQRLGITGIYRQESYKAVSTTTVMATYTVGL